MIASIKSGKNDGLDVKAMKFAVMESIDGGTIVAPIVIPRSCRRLDSIVVLKC